jgi:glutaredoxin 3
LTKISNVVVYSASWCGYCRALKQKLEAMEIMFTEKNIDEDEVREEMNQKTSNNQTIPVLFIGEKYWVNPSISILQEQFSKK